MRISINEMFTSFQGTGSLAGQRQFFVRTQGCSIKCPIRHICDEPAALPVNIESYSGPGGDSLISIDSIVQKALDEVGKGGWLHITGGEPLEYLEEWKALVMEAMSAGLRVQTQTSGMIDHGMPAGRAGRVTVSPKAPCEETKLKHGTELILVAAPWVSPSIAAGFIEKTSFDFYYIVPAHLGGGKWSNGKAVDLVDRLLEMGQPQWRLSHQLHKIFGIK